LQIILCFNSINAKIVTIKRGRRHLQEAHEVLARKYRPTNFDELIGQETIAQTLSLALDANRLSHAYLFSVSSDGENHSPSLLRATDSETPKQYALHPL